MPNREDYGFITPAVRRLFSIFDEMPSRFFLGRRASLVLPSEPEKLKAYAQARAVKVDRYVCVWVLIEICLNFLAGQSSRSILVLCLITALCCIRTFEVFVANVNINIFRAATNPNIASIVRILVLTIINYGEIWLCFSAIYAAHVSMLSVATGVISGWDTLYFSGTTQLTIGFGDIVPTGWMRLVTIAQGWIGAMFILLILGRLMGIVPPLREIATADNRADDRTEQMVAPPEPPKTLAP